MIEDLILDSGGMILDFRYLILFLSQYFVLNTKNLNTKK